MLSLPLLVLATITPALAASYYPDPKTSELEHLLVDTGGIDDGGIKTVSEQNHYAQCTKHFFAKTCGLTRRSLLAVSILWARRHSAV